MPTHPKGNNITFGISMAPELALEIKQRAAELSLPVSGYLRQCVLKELRMGAGQPLALETFMDAAPKYKNVKKRKGQK